MQSVAGADPQKKIATPQSNQGAKKHSIEYVLDLKGLDGPAGAGPFQVGIDIHTRLWSKSYIVSGRIDFWSRNPEQHAAGGKLPACERNILSRQYAGIF